MTRQQRIMLGLAAGAAAMLALRKGLRERHAISFDGPSLSSPVDPAVSGW